MRCLLLISFLLLGISHLANADSWWKTYEEGWIGYSVIETYDGNYAVASYAPDNSGILKFDRAGNVLWFQEQYMIAIQSIKQTTDNGFITSGYAGANNEIIVTKADSLGQFEWEFFYWVEDPFAGGYCVIQTKDGGYVVTGAVLLKLDASGKLVWLRKYDGMSHYVSQTSDGGYIVCGQQESKLWLLKTDSRGKIEWERLFEIASSEGYAVHQTPDGGYLIGASAIMVKTNSQGDILWTHVYDDKGLHYCLSLEPTSDGNYIASGYTTSFSAGGKDAWFMKIDQQGNVKWKRYWASPWDDIADNACQTSDGGYIISGSGSSFAKKTLSLLLIKTDAYGNLPIEISPTAILSPWKDYPVTAVKPKARFLNKSSSRCNYDIYYHCAIVGFDSHEADRHDSVLVKGGLDAWKTVDIEFPEWTSEYVSAYRATFWATGTGGHSFPSEPMSITFYKKSDVEEAPQPEPLLEILNPVGDEIILKFRGCSRGFSAEIFEASGRKIDELCSTQERGTLTWGKGHSSGVYFLRFTDGDRTKILKVAIVR